MSYIGNSPEFWNLNVNKYSYTATAGQTIFPAVYDSVVDVFLNGSKLQVDVDYTATDGVSVVLSDGATAGDVVDIQGYFNMTNFDIDNYDVSKLTTENWSIEEIDGVLDIKLNDQSRAKLDIYGNFTITGDYNSHPIDEIIEYDFKKVDAFSPLFTKVYDASFTIAPNFITIVDGVLVGTNSSTVTLSLNSNLDTGSKVAGTDYYVYALSNGNFIISANASYPSGYSSSNSRKIGGFHYGLIPESFTAINNITSADAAAIRGINAYSFWDLKFRPVSAPEGMHYVLGRWYDIYLLNSEHIVNGTSKAGATIAAGSTAYGRAYPKVPLAFGGNGTTTYGSFTWFEAGEIAKAYNKKLISYEDFSSLAYGVLEEASSGDSDATVKHIANFTSKWGTCQATGVEYIWGADINNGYGTSDFSWRSGLTETRGQIYATSNAPTAVVLGGRWSEGSYSGSRCSNWTIYVWISSWSFGARFASDHLMLV